MFIALKSWTLDIIPVRISVEQFLDQTATRGTWYGGGSAAALACALSASLMEKLSCQASTARASRTIRRECTALIETDARVFRDVIRASAQGSRAGFTRALKTAIRVPWQVFDASRRLQQLAPKIGRHIRPRYRVDLRCAVAIARASGASAKFLVATNLAWLGDRAYSRRLLRRMARPA